jgi:hypothetical protein
MEITFRVNGVTFGVDETAWRTEPFSESCITFLLLPIL